MAYTTINKSTDYFNTKLYTGNESTRSETGVGFQPDFTWIKVRSRADPHILTDAVRGTSSQLSSDTTGAQQTFSNMITSFNSDGFSLGANVDVNRNSETFASWNWKANGAGSANTDGSISSTVSANTTSGFSIVKYTGNASAGATIGHGLGVIPKMIIAKKLNGSPNWGVYHAGLGSASKYLELNTTASATTDNAVWDGANPTNSLVYLGSDNKTNGSGGDYIAYCFADVQGYSKFGSYTGNGNADGTFVYTGFKPAWVMIKLSSAADDWQIFDNKRNTFNIMDKYLRPNSSLGTVTNAVIDFTSNGFKLRSSAGSFNPSGGTAIYMAFAEEPLVGDNPATAR